MNRRTAPATISYEARRKCHDKMRKEFPAAFCNQTDAALDALLDALYASVLCVDPPATVRPAQDQEPPQ